MAITLEKVFQSITDYVSKHESNYTIIEDSVNSILLQLGGATSSLSVPVGLQEIFDRDGVIGISSYRLTDQTVVSNELVIPPGAVWLGLQFASKISGTTLNTTSLVTGTRYIDVDTAGLPKLVDVQTSFSVYSFEWDSGTAVISDATLLIAILFDGDDYQGQLSTYDSVADRLADIESQLGVLGSMYAQDLGTTTGLTFGYQEGTVRNDNVMQATVAGTTVLADDDVNYVEVNPNTGAVSDNVVGFTTLLVPLFEVTTVAGAITLVTDQRTWAALGGGGGGGHSQNTDIGTDAAEFKLNRLVAGAPSLNGSFKVERGTSSDVDVRWNEATDTWEFTNDGTIYNSIGAPDLGVQELTKTYMFENPPLVVNSQTHSTDGAYVMVDLTADTQFNTIISGVRGMILRVQYQDTAPTGGTTVLFRKLYNPAFSPQDPMRVYAQNTANIDSDEGHIIIVEGEGRDPDDILKIGFEYQATASGVGTATLEVYVLGYFEKVTGVGTQDQVFVFEDNSVPLNDTVEFNLPYTNRGLVHNMVIEETTGNPTLSYNIKMYSKDTFLAADLVYQVDNIVPGSPWTDTLPWMQVDDDATAELHVSIQNTDLAQAGEYDITLRTERFA